MAMGWEIKGKESSNESSDDLAGSNAGQAGASDPLAYFRGNFDVDISLEAPQRNGEAAPAGNPVVKLREPSSMTKAFLSIILTSTETGTSRFSLSINESMICNTGSSY
jgi:hypothetical protein